MFCHKMRAGFAAAVAAGSMYAMYAGLAKYAPERASELITLMHSVPMTAMHFVKGLVAIMAMAFIFVYLFKIVKGMFACCDTACQSGKQGCK